MLTLFNDILSTYALPGIVLGFALCFFFIRIPPCEGLRGYSMARRMMGWCYIALFAALVAEGVSVKMSSPPLLLQLIMVTIGILQAFLFTFALTTLIDVQFFTWRRFVREKTNFKGWVNMFRINEAERLIRDGFLNNHTTDSLANAVGFANRVSFYRVFKKATGYSPTDWTY